MSFTQTVTAKRTTAPPFFLLMFLGNASNIWFDKHQMLC